MACMPSSCASFWFKLALHMRQIEAALGNTTSGVRPAVLLGAETRGSTLEQQWRAPITDVLLHRSTGSAPDTSLIWQMLRRKVRGRRESRHTHLTLPPYRHAAPSFAPKWFSQGWMTKTRPKTGKEFHFCFGCGQAELGLYCLADRGDLWKKTGDTRWGEMGEVVRTSRPA